MAEYGHFAFRYYICNLFIGKVTFRWKSFATAYAIVFYIFMTGVVIIVGRERLHILTTTKRFDDKIYAILFVIFLVPHFWIPFVGWGKAAPHHTASILECTRMIVDSNEMSRRRMPFLRMSRL